MPLNSLFNDDIENIVFLMAEFESTSLIWSRLRLMIFDISVYNISKDAIITLTPSKIFLDEIKWTNLIEQNKNYGILNFSGLWYCSRFLLVSINSRLFRDYNPRKIAASFYKEFSRILIDKPIYKVFFTKMILNLQKPNQKYVFYYKPRT